MARTKKHTSQTDRMARIRKAKADKAKARAEMVKAAKAACAASGIDVDSEALERTEVSRRVLSINKAVVKADAILPVCRRMTDAFADDKAERRVWSRKEDRANEALDKAGDRLRILNGDGALTAKGKRLNAVIRQLESKGYDAHFGFSRTAILDTVEVWLADVPANMTASKLAADIMADIDKGSA